MIDQHYSHLHVIPVLVWREFAWACSAAPVRGAVVVRGMIGL